MLKQLIKRFDTGFRSYTHTRKIYLPQLLTLIVIMLLISGCQANATSERTYDIVATGTLTPGESIPTPQDEVMLTVRGKVGTTNREATIVMDQKTIEAVGLVEYSVHDPFEDRSVVYQGVLMSDLLELWQVSDDVTTARFSALNDYHIDIPLEDFYQYPVLFALQADGVYMEPSYRGPAMLVYPLDDYEFDLIGIKRRWIWQIASIELQ